MKHQLPALRRTIGLVALLSLVGAGSGVADAAGAGHAVAATATAAFYDGTTDLGATVPTSVAVAPGGRQAFVGVTAGSGPSGYSAALDVLDTATGAVTATIALPAASSERLGQLGFSPDGSRLYVLTGQALSVVDTATDTVLTSVAAPVQTTAPGWLQGALTGLAVSPDGTSVYVSQYGATAYRQNGPARVLVFSPTTGAFTTSVTLPGTYGYANGMLVRGGTDAYVSTDAGLVHLAVGAGAAPTVLATVAQPAGESGTDGVAISPDGSRIYAVATNTGLVHVISTATDTITGTITFSSGYLDLRYPVVSGDGSSLYVVDDDVNGPKVRVANTATRKVGRPLTDIDTDQLWGAAPGAGGSTLLLTGVATPADGGAGSVQFLPTH
ncbi:YncE family protein [Kitasatospora mediocidica]|uniref:YncE family protein n=1 Tax=Kitasatospora mediocidica TaxID=58352 RepID=UPI00068ED566|nr:YncE family protein [Kitasatospora mediocidica]